MIKKILFGTEPLSSLSANLSFLALRVFVGLSMAFAHGAMKMPPPQGFVDGLGEMGLPFPFFMAWCAGISEFIGGILLALGLFTRPSAALIAGTMFVAGFIHHAADPYRMKELAFLYLFTAIFFIFWGGGPLSLDRLIFKRK